MKENTLFYRGYPVENYFLIPGWIADRKISSIIYSLAEIESTPMVPAKFQQSVWNAKNMSFCLGLASNTVLIIIFTID